MPVRRQRRAACMRSLELRLYFLWRREIRVQVGSEAHQMKQAEAGRTPSTRRKRLSSPGVNPCKRKLHPGSPALENIGKERALKLHPLRCSDQSTALPSEMVEEQR